MMDDRKWSRPFPKESGQPHEIVTKKGERVDLGYYYTKGAATRELNRRIARYDKRRHGPEDPRTWKVQLVRENA